MLIAVIGHYEFDRSPRGYIIVWDTECLQIVIGSRKRDSLHESSESVSRIGLTSTDVRIDHMHTNTLDEAAYLAWLAFQQHEDERAGEPCERPFVDEEPWGE
jgi:hypothetical protein